MKIAVTYEDGNVFQHFGKTENFIVCDAEDGSVTGHEVINTDGNGHGALAGFLKEHGVDVLICGGIGGGARTALSQAGITLVPGVSGDALKAAEQYAAGTLEFDENAQCHDHDHEGHHGSHQCGGHHGDGHVCGR